MIEACADLPEREHPGGGGDSRIHLCIDREGDTIGSCLGIETQVNPPKSRDDFCGFDKPKSHGWGWAALVSSESI